MTKRIVKFSETEFHYMAQGDIAVSVYNDRYEYTGVSIVGDRKFIRPSWDLMPDVVRGFSITKQATHPALYIHWHSKDKPHKKGEPHKRCIGIVKNLEEATAWVEKANKKYQGHQQTN